MILSSLPAHNVGRKTLIRPGSTNRGQANRVCALGSADRVEAQLRAYHEAGADCVAVVPSTAEDPGGRATLRVAMTAVSTNQEI
jgi:alkanesulfonate monooxygenase SsuD/methylene tetrahydromethanopterin reductase-like flavin-dependent oxidoreductase (luciferase family)